MDSLLLLDEFTTITLGEPFRLFPFGTVVKNGKRREFTRELAARMMLPHFKPPIKLGSHDEKTAAGGFITALEVRDDGLYAVPEWNDEGGKALTKGSYRYHSPEVIWETGVIENPTTGELNSAPLIWGDALLHTPHLGEGAALYSVTPYQKNGGQNMTHETVSVPVNLWERFLTWFDSNSTQKPEPTPAAPEPANGNIDQYKAQADEYAAKVAAYEARIQEMEAASQYNARVVQYSTEFASHPAIAQNTELHQQLAKLPEDTAVYFSTQLKALAAQIKESNLTTDVGANGHGNSPIDAFSALVTAYMAEHKVPYHMALPAVAAAHPELAQEVS